MSSITRIQLRRGTGTSWNSYTLEAGEPGFAIDSGELRIGTTGGQSWADAKLINDGATAAAGPMGPTGSVGPTGPAGATGPAGPTGADSTVAGPRGATGATGADGINGAVGARGATGATGADSTVAGPAGPTGADGINGAVGARGATGATGADSTVAGPAGPTGATGADSTVAGPAGPTGATGADSTVAGPAGPTGATGADSTVAGPAGPTGATGADSTVAGPAGPTGATGAVEFSGTIGAILYYDGSAVTGNSAFVWTEPGEFGSSAYRLSGGVNGNFINLDEAGSMDMVIGSPDVGSTILVCAGSTEILLTDSITGSEPMPGTLSILIGGTAGSSGEFLGSDGAGNVVWLTPPTSTGTTGAGPAGPTGATGADSTVAGPAGPTGATGADSTVAGPAGPTGATGADSTVAGPAGPTGATGADSTVAGPAGPTGATGAVEFSGPTGAILYYDGSIVTGSTGLVYDGISIITNETSGSYINLNSDGSQLGSNAGDIVISSGPGASLIFNNLSNIYLGSASLNLGSFGQIYDTSGSVGEAGQVLMNNSTQYPVWSDPPSGSGSAAQGPTGSIQLSDGVGGFTGSTGFYFDASASYVIYGGPNNNYIQFDTGDGTMAISPGGITGALTLASNNQVLSLNAGTTLQVSTAGSYGAAGQYLGSDSNNNVVWSKPPSVLYGIDGPIEGTGVTGDSHINTSTGDVYLKVNPAWTEQIGSGEKFWTSVASDSTGGKLIAGVAGEYVYLSKNAGVSWTPLSSLGSKYWSSVSSSPDGSILAAAAITTEYIYVSTDSGASWNPTSMTGDWSGCAISKDGLNLIACSTNDYVYTGTKVGNTYDLVAEAGLTFTREWTGVALNQSGTLSVACATDDYVYIKSAGIWTAQDIGGNTKNWTSVASNIDGTILVACADDDYVYVSIDSGASWVQQTDLGTGEWTSVSSNNSGSLLLACYSKGGYVYEGRQTIDDGYAWTSELPYGSWNSVASNSIGNQLVAVANGKHIHTYAEGWAYKINIPTASAGATGATGDAGPTGATGATGAVEFTGPTFAVLYYDGTGVTGNLSLRWNDDATGDGYVLVGGPNENYFTMDDGFGNMLINASSYGETGHVTISSAKGDIVLNAASGRLIVELGSTGMRGTEGQYLGSDGNLGTVWRSLPPIPEFKMSFGNVLLVDQIKGNDGSGLAGGPPYMTVDAAARDSVSGDLIWVMPGTYNLTQGLMLNEGVSIRGASTQTTTIQMQGVTGDTTLLTLVGYNRVEDVTLRLQSTEHHTLKGIYLAGQSSVTSKLRTCVLTVDNRTAGSVGLSEVYGVEAGGTGTLGPASFSFNSLKGSTINVYSDGGGKKRGILVSNSNVMSTRDLNVYVAQPTTPTVASGSYIGVETNDTSGLTLGSIQMRATTIGTVKKGGLDTYTVSDILQTTPSTVADPTYLASPGIQIGPGVDLVTKSAGGNPFSTYNYPATIYYGVKGTLSNGPATGGYLWPGTISVINTTGGAAQKYPDPDTNAAYYRIQQPAILSGINIACTTGPANPNETYIQIYYTPKTTGIRTELPGYRFVLTDSTTELSYYNTTKDFNAGDKISVGVTFSGTTNNTTHDLTIQLDMF